MTPNFHEAPQNRSLDSERTIVHFAKFFVGLITSQPYVAHINVADLPVIKERMVYQARTAAAFYFAKNVEAFHLWRQHGESIRGHLSKYVRLVDCNLTWLTFIDSNSELILNTINTFLNQFEPETFVRFFANPVYQHWIGPTEMIEIFDATLGRSGIRQFKWYELNEMLDNPRFEQFMSDYSFFDIMMTRSFRWQDRDDLSFFSVPFLMHNEAFFQKILPFVRHKDLPIPLTLPQRLVKFEEFMLLLGRAGLREVELMNQLQADYETQAKQTDPSFEWKRLVPRKQQSFRRGLRSNLSQKNEMAYRQYLLAAKNFDISDWRLSPLELSRIHLLESDYYPLRHLHVNSGYELEYLALGTNSSNHHAQSMIQNAESQPHFSASIFNALHFFKVVKMGNDTGEVSPLPTLHPEHANLLFERMMDAGLIDIYSFYGHSCHFNLEVKTKLGFSAICNMLRGTGYVFHSQVGDALNQPFVKDFSISVHEKSKNQIDYFECKQFRFYKPESHFQMMRCGNKLGIALHAAEKLFAHSASEFYEKKLMNIDLHRFLSLSENDVLRAPSNKLTEDEEKLALIWIKTFTKFRKALAAIGAGHAWQSVVPAQEEWLFQMRLKQIFDSPESHLYDDLIDQEYAAGHGFPFASQIEVDQQKYPNFPAFCRDLVQTATDQVEAVLSESMIEMRLQVDEICRLLKHPNFSEAKQRVVADLVWQFTNRYTYLAPPKTRTGDVSDKYLLELANPGFLELQQVLERAGF